MVTLQPAPHCCAVTGRVVTEKVVLELPPGTVIVAGICTRVELLCAGHAGPAQRVTATPDSGATVANVTVPDTELPPATEL
jgi:hypothetical protein